MSTTTLSNLALTQLQDSTKRVHVTAKVADSANSAVALTYEFKHASSSTWLPAVTTGLHLVNATVAGVNLDFYWDLDASSVDTAATADFNFRITGSSVPTPSTGSLTAVAADLITGVEKGDSVSILGRVYEFTTDGVVTAGHVPVKLTSDSQPASTVKSALLAAIAADPTAPVTAASGTGNLVNFTSKVTGTASNVAITASMVNAGVVTALALVGMSGAVNASTPSVVSGTLTAAQTGAVPPLSEDVSYPPAYLAQRNAVYVQTLEKRGTVKGSRPQAFLQGPAAYAALDKLRAGTYQKFSYDMHYGQLQNPLTVSQMDMRQSLNELTRPGHPDTASPTVGYTQVRRAVLISVAEFNRVTTGQSIPVTLESKQWLAYKAYRSFTRIFANPDTVYAIYEDTFTNGAQGMKVETKTVIAYLLLESKYEALYT